MAKVFRGGLQPDIRCGLLLLAQRALALLLSEQLLLRRYRLCPGRCLHAGDGQCHAHRQPPPQRAAAYITSLFHDALFPAIGCQTGEEPVGRGSTLRESRYRKQSRRAATARRSTQNCEARRRAFCCRPARGLCPEWAVASAGARDASRSGLVGRFTMRCDIQAGALCFLGDTQADHAAHHQQDQRGHHRRPQHGEADADHLHPHLMGDIQIGLGAAQRLCAEHTSA
ncbi:hypothetical protein G6F59_013651 [Rhizopus arrhizus]|nr:hypothetical protein G6F59_013651 [Rhizopus arrhizus]